MTDRRQHTYVTLRYADSLAAIEWLTSTLGFVTHEIHTDEDGTISHALLSFGEDLIMLGDSRGGTPATQTVYLARDDVDEHYAAAVAAGAEVTKPIQTMDYGTREYSVLDPEANTWAVGTYRPSVG